MNRSLLRRSASLAAAGLLACLAAAPALAHTVKTAGSYTLEIGWQHEPTYVGETNGVQVIVTDANEDPSSRTWAKTTSRSSFDRLGSERRADLPTGVRSRGGRWADG